MSQTPEQAHLPLAAPPRNHGNTLAAWVTVTVILVGGLISSFAVVASTAWLFWAGLVVVLAGLVVGRVMRMLGLGQPTDPAQR